MCMADETKPRSEQVVRIPDPFEKVFYRMIEEGIKETYNIHIVGIDSGGVAYAHGVHQYLQQRLADREREFPLYTVGVRRDRGLMDRERFEEDITRGLIPKDQLEGATLLAVDDNIGREARTKKVFGQEVGDYLTRSYGVIGHWYAAPKTELASDGLPQADFWGAFTIGKSGTIDRRGILHQIRGLPPEDQDFIRRYIDLLEGKPSPTVAQLVYRFLRRNLDLRGLVRDTAKTWNYFFGREEEAEDDSNPALKRLFEMHRRRDEDKPL